MRRRLALFIIGQRRWFTTCRPIACHAWSVIVTAMTTITMAIVTDTVMVIADKVTDF